jgi:hypothetical protein
VKTTRRTAVTASGVAVLGLTGCTADEPASSHGTASARGSTATETVTGTVATDPDQVALDRAIAVTSSLLALLEAGPAALDPAGRLAAMHTAHLRVLQEATSSGTPSTPPSTPSVRTDAQRLRRHELGARRELAALAQAAESGALARVLASMSAGIAALLSHRGEVPE